MHQTRDQLSFNSTIWIKIYNSFFFYILWGTLAIWRFTLKQTNKPTCQFLPTLTGIHHLVSHTITFTLTNQPNKLEISSNVWTHSSINNTTGQQHEMKISQTITAERRKQKTKSFIFTRSQTFRTLKCPDIRRFLFVSFSFRSHSFKNSKRDSKCVLCTERADVPSVYVVLKTDDSHETTDPW